MFVTYCTMMLSIHGPKISTATKTAMIFGMNARRRRLEDTDRKTDDEAETKHRCRDEEHHHECLLSELYHEIPRHATSSRTMNLLKAYDE